MNKIILSLSLLLFAFSCNKETIEIDRDITEVTLTAQLSDAAIDSRVATDYSNDSYWDFSWEGTETIYGWYTGCSEPIKYTIEDFDLLTLTFKGEIGDGDYHRFIYQGESDQMPQITANGDLKVDISEQNGNLNKTYLINDQQIPTQYLSGGNVNDIDVRQLGGFMVVDLLLKDFDSQSSYTLTSLAYSDIPVTAEIDMSEIYDSQSLHLNKTNGTVTVSELNEPFTAVTLDGVNYMKATIRLNILPFDLAVGQSVDIDFTVSVTDKDSNSKGLVGGATLTNNGESSLPFARATHNYTVAKITADMQSGITITGATINGWATTVDRGELTFSEIDISYNTITSTYEIYSANGLRAFADLVNGTACSVSNLATEGASEYFNFGAVNRAIRGKLIRDIDLGGIDDQGKGVEENIFTPIGNSNCKYYGIFDGGGHQISGLYINSLTSYMGLFGVISSATIKNLTVSGSVTADMYSGGIIGDTYDSTIDNCTNLVSVYGLGTIGGITGNAYQSTITNCKNVGDIESSGSRTGGIVGSHIVTGDIATAVTIACYISDCSNEGSVEGATNTGGIVGETASRISITNCYNRGDIRGTVSDGAIGGIIGSAFYPGNYAGCIQLVSCCYNSGLIDGGQDVGGIAGYADSYTIENCYNSGVIDGGSNSGGITGSLCDNSEILYCYNRGSVKSSGSNSGGVAGYADNSILYYCLSNSEVTGSDSATLGGVIGKLSNTKSAPSYCYYDSAVMANITAIGTSDVTSLTEVYGVEYLTTMITSGSAAAQFNSIQIPDPWQEDVSPNINDGYPILTWQVE